MTTHLVWFRRDLRLHDNLALAAACRDRSAQVLALYIATPEQWKAHDMAPRQAAFTSAQLNAWTPSKVSACSMTSVDYFITINMK